MVSDTAPASAATTADCGRLTSTRVSKREGSAGWGTVVLRIAEHREPCSRRRSPWPIFPTDHVCVKAGYAEPIRSLPKLHRLHVTTAATWPLTSASSAYALSGSSG